MASLFRRKKKTAKDDPKSKSTPSMTPAKDAVPAPPDPPPTPPHEADDAPSALPDNTSNGGSLVTVASGDTGAYRKLNPEGTLLELRHRTRTTTEGEEEIGVPGELPKRHGEKGPGVTFANAAFGPVPSPSTTPPPATTRGRRFRPSTVMADPSQQYDLIQEVGEGSYGKVYKAKHHITQVVVAIKVMPVENDLDDLNKEISALKKVRDSPYIVSYHGSFQQDNALWIVMDLCEAGSICDILTVCDRELSEDEIADVIAQTLLGLVHLHCLHLIHRDVKAGNILLTNDGHAKLADFGVSAQVTTLVTKRNTLIGSPYWMAPEVIQESKYDERCDVWSLGITLIEMAESVPPLDNVHPMRAIFQIPKRPPPVFGEPSKWSADMVEFLGKCVVKNQDERAHSKDLLQHPWIANRATRIQGDGGASPTVKALALECGPIISKYYLEEKHKGEDLEDGSGGTLKLASPNATTTTRVSGTAAGAGAAGTNNVSSTPGLHRDPSARSVRKSRNMENSGTFETFPVNPADLVGSPGGTKTTGFSRNFMHYFRAEDVPAAVAAAVAAGEEDGVPVVDGGNDSGTNTNGGTLKLEKGAPEEVVGGE